MATPHIDAPSDAFAQTVLLPGDPARAAYIAEHFFDQPRRVCSLRNMWGYTGSYRGHPVSVMGTGMGIPSSLIYATELIEHFGVKRLLRIGTCGTVSAELDLGDIVLALGACTDSGVNRQRFGAGDFAAIASFGMVEPLVATARAKGLSMRVGNVFSTDLFYSADPLAVSRMQAMGVLGVEMEAAGLYGLAAQKQVEAATLLTVSDHLLDGRSMASAARQSGLETMIGLALDSLWIDPVQ